MSRLGANINEIVMTTKLHQLILTGYGEKQPYIVCYLHSLLFWTISKFFSSFPYSFSFENSTRATRCAVLRCISCGKQTGEKATDLHKGASNRRRGEKIPWLQKTKQNRRGQIDRLIFFDASSLSCLSQSRSATVSSKSACHEQRD